MYSLCFKLYWLLQVHWGRPTRVIRITLDFMAAIFTATSKFCCQFTAILHRVCTCHWLIYVMKQYRLSWNYHIEQQLLFDTRNQARTFRRWSRVIQNGDEGNPGLILLDGEGNPNKIWLKLSHTIQQNTTIRSWYFWKWLLSKQIYMVPWILCHSDIWE